MGFNHRTIDFGCWREMQIEGVPFDLRSFFVWLVTNEHTHFSGLYYLRKATIADETNRTIKEVDRDLAALSEKPYIQYDEETSHIFVVNMAKRQMKSSYAYNMVLGLNNHLKTIQSPVLIAGFMEKYAGLSAKDKKGKTVTLEAPEITTPLEPKPLPPKRQAPAKSLPKVDETAIWARFERWYEFYPRKDGKEAGKKAWKKIDPDDAMTEMMIKAIQAATKVHEWNTKERQFVPLPASWLNGKRWEDQLATTGAAPTAKMCTAETPAPRNCKPGEWRHPQAVVHIGKDNLKIATCPHCDIKFQV